MMYLINWVKRNRIESILIFLIILIATVLRFYDNPGYMTFLGDEGRDALIVKSLLTEGDIPFIGPPTSVGNIYLGPFYYYMMAISMAIFWLNPVAAVGMIAFIGVLTVGLIYYLARSWFGKWPAVVSSLLYAISPITIIYSKSSWNPNPAPFFTLLGILGFWKSHQTKNFWWLLLTGFSLGVAVQMHYLALILLPVFGLLWLYELWIILKNKNSKVHFLLATFFAIAVFVITILPLILFDFKHYFLNSRAIFELFTSSGAVENNFLVRILRIFPIYTNDLIGEYMTSGNKLLSLILAVVIIFPLIFNRKPVWPILMLGIWLLTGLIGLSLYKGQIYAHYLGFLNPAPYLLLGAIVGSLKRFLIGVGGVFIALLILINLAHSPLLKPPNKQLERTKEIAHFVINEASGKPYNFALISEHNYDAAYQFYLDIYGFKPMSLPFDKTGQLFVVCEDENCQPIGHSKYEIAAFGYAKVEKVYETYGVKIYKLVPNPGGKP